MIPPGAGALLGLALTGASSRGSSSVPVRGRLQEAPALPCLQQHLPEAISAVPTSLGGTAAPPWLFPRPGGAPRRAGDAAVPPQKPLLGWGHRGLAGLGGSRGPFFVGRRGEVKRSGSLISASQSHGLIVWQDERVRWKGWSCSKSPLQSLPGLGAIHGGARAAVLAGSALGLRFGEGRGAQPQVGQGAGHLQVALFMYPRASFRQEGSQGRFGKGKGQAGGLMCGKGGREVVMGFKKLFPAVPAPWGQVSIKR